MEEIAVEGGKNIYRMEQRRKQEEILWKLKSRVQWIRKGEKNTKLFHKSMIKHKNHNNIFSHFGSDGQHMLQHDDIEYNFV